MLFVFSSEGAAKWQAGGGKTIRFVTCPLFTVYIVIVKEYFIGTELNDLTDYIQINHA